MYLLATQTYDPVWIEPVICITNYNTLYSIFLLYFFYYEDQKFVYVKILSVYAIEATKTLIAHVIYLYSESLGFHDVTVMKKMYIYNKWLFI